MVLRRGRRRRQRSRSVFGCALAGLVSVERIGLGKLLRLEPPEPSNRYERKRPGELVHVDGKKLGRILKPGHRVTGNRRGRQKKRFGHQVLGVAGWGFVHVCADEAGPTLAYV